MQNIQKHELANVLLKALEELDPKRNTFHKEVCIEAYMLLTGGDKNSVRQLLIGEEFFTGFTEEDFEPDVEPDRDTENYKSGYSEGIAMGMWMKEQEFFQRMQKLMFDEVFVMNTRELK